MSRHIHSPTCPLPPAPSLLSPSLRAAPRGNTSQRPCRGGEEPSLSHVVPTPAAAAIDSFDAHHRSSAQRAQILHEAWQSDCTHLAKREAMRHAELDLRRNRAHVVEALAPVTRVVSRHMAGKRSAPKPKWRLEDSIWRPRKKWCDARDFFDTVAVRRAAFEADWRVAAAALRKFVARHDDGDENLTGEASGGTTAGGAAVGEAAAGEAAASGEGGERGGLDEMMEVADVLWEHSEVIYLSFKFYCTYGASDDLFHLFFNGFTLWAESSKLIDPANAFAKKSAWDQMFVAVDSAGGGGDGGPADPHNKKKALNRQEFLQVLVRASVMRYVQPGLETDVSTALMRLLEQDIRPRADPACLTHPNAFRKAVYVAAVDEVLRRHEPSLRLLFVGMCGLKPVTMENGGLANGLATFANWRELLRLLDMYGPDLVERDACLCFAWSKMVTVNEQSTKDRIKMTHMAFEDFLEALCRVACLKALPTDDEIRAADAAGGSAGGNAGTHLIRLQEAPAEYDAFLLQRRTPWGKMPADGKGKPVPIERCVEHLCELLIVTCQGGKDRSERDGLTLNQRHVTRVFGGRASSRASSPMPS